MAEELFKKHSWTSTEFWLLILFVVILATNKWLEIPELHLQWIGYATGGYTGLRQLIKVKSPI